MNTTNRHKTFATQNKAQATSEVMFILTEIILVLAAGFLVFGKINSIDDDQLFLKKFYSRDLALLIDAVEALQGNLFYRYNPSQTTLSKLTFKFTPTTVEANDEKYPVAGKHVREITIEKPKRALQLIKGGDEIIIKEQSSESKQQFNPNKINCPNVKTSISGILMIDPGHGFNPSAEKGFQGEKGFEGKQGVESELVLAVAQVFEGGLKLQGLSAAKTRDSVNDAKTTGDRKNEASTAEIVVSIHANKDVEEINNVKAYINYDSEKYFESMKLACLLLNEVSSAFARQTTGTAIIPVDLQQFDEDDAKQLLDGRKVAVLIELGNINSEKAFLSKFADVGNAMTKAVLNYQK